MSVNLSSVHIEVLFNKHTVYADVHSGLNSQYGGSLENIDDLFVDPANKVELKDNAVDILKQLVIDSIVPYTSTNDRNPVSQVLDNTPIGIAWKAGQSATPISKDSLQQAMTRSAQSKSKSGFRCCILMLDIQSYRFPVNCMLLDWSEFKLCRKSQPAAATSTPGQGLNAGVSAAEFAASIYTPTTNLNAHATYAAGNAESGQSAVGRHSVNRLQGVYSINPSNIPGNTKEMHGNQSANEIIAKSSTYFRHFYDDNDRLFLNIPVFQSGRV